MLQDALSLSRELSRSCEPDMFTLALFIHKPPDDWSSVRRYVKHGGIVIAGHFSHAVYANMFQTHVPKGIWHGSCQSRGFPEQHKFNESDHLWRTLTDHNGHSEPTASAAGCGPSTYECLGLTVPQFYVCTAENDC